jgi:hypothetical protein
MGGRLKGQYGRIDAIALAVRGRAIIKNMA